MEKKPRRNDIDLRIVRQLIFNSPTALNVLLGSVGWKVTDYFKHPGDDPTGRFASGDV